MSLSVGFALQSYDTRTVEFVNYLYVFMDFLVDPRCLQDESGATKG